MSTLVRKHFWQKFVQNGKCDGYRKRKKIIYRISNDIVQGFEIFPEPRSPLVTVRWAVYPLCQPDANFYFDFYQMYDINDITGQPTLDVAYNRFNLGSIEACAEELHQKVDKILRPYFDRMHGCEEALAACVQLDLRSGEDFPTMEKVYFSLKLAQYEKAISYVNQIIQNNELAIKRNAEYYSGEKLDIMKQKHEKKELKLKNFSKYIQYEEKRLIQERLKANEEKARTFLGEC